MRWWRKPQKPMTMKAANPKIAEPAARPSSPSVRFTALVVAEDEEDGEQRPTDGAELDARVVVAG